MNVEENMENYFSLFGRNSPVLVVNEECKDEVFSLEKLLSEFGFDFGITLFDRLSMVESVLDRDLFSEKEILLLEKMNQKLDIPVVYFLTEKMDKDAITKLIKSGNYSKISKYYHYTTITTSIAACYSKEA